MHTQIECSNEMSTFSVACVSGCMSKHSDLFWHFDVCVCVSVCAFSLCVHSLLRNEMVTITQYNIIYIKINKEKKLNEQTPKARRRWSWLERKEPTEEKHLKNWIDAERWLDEQESGPQQMCSIDNEHRRWEKDRIGGDEKKLVRKKIVVLTRKFHEIYDYCYCLLYLLVFVGVVVVVVIIHQTRIHSTHTQACTCEDVSHRLHFDTDDLSSSSHPNTVNVRLMMSTVSHDQARPSIGGRTATDVDPYNLNCTFIGRRSTAKKAAIIGSTDQTDCAKSAHFNRCGTINTSKS